MSVFIDGQNLFKQAQRCFGDLDVPYENYDPIALAKALVQGIPGGVLRCVHFYSGRPWAWGKSEGEANLSRFLERKIRHYMVKAPGVFFAQLKPLAYRPPERPGGRPVGREKGVDVAIAIDVVMGVVDHAFDAAIILSQDKDLNDVSSAVSKVRDRFGRWTHLVSAFPSADPGAEANLRISKTGISNTHWAPISRALYRTCLDQQDFRDRYESGSPIPFPGDFEYVGHVRTTTCQPLLATRTQLNTRDVFPACPSCGGRIFWARYKRFVPD